MILMHSLSLILKLQTTEQDLEPETSVEDVAPVEAEPLNQTTTAIAKIYQLPNITENGEPSPRSTKVACLNITRDDSTVEVSCLCGKVNCETNFSVRTTYIMCVFWAIIDCEYNGTDEHSVYKSWH